MFRYKKQVPRKSKGEDHWEMTDCNNMLSLYPPPSDKGSEAVQDVALRPGKVTLWMRGFWNFFRNQTRYTS